MRQLPLFPNISLPLIAQILGRDRHQKPSSRSALLHPHFRRLRAQIRLLPFWPIPHWSAANIDAHDRRGGQLGCAAGAMKRGGRRRGCCCSSTPDSAGRGRGRLRRGRLLRALLLLSGLLPHRQRRIVRRCQRHRRHLRAPATSQPPAQWLTQPPAQQVIRHLPLSPDLWTANPSVSPKPHGCGCCHQYSCIMLVPPAMSAVAIQMRLQDKAGAASSGNTDCKKLWRHWVHALHGELLGSLSMKQCLHAPTVLLVDSLLPMQRVKTVQ